MEIIIFTIKRMDNWINQDHLEFLKTDKGYKLISLSIRGGE